jgi:hypothetical protein
MRLWRNAIAKSAGIRVLRYHFQARGLVRKILRNLLSPHILDVVFAVLNNESLYSVDIGLLGTNGGVLLADLIRYLIEQFHENNNLPSL